MTKYKDVWRDGELYSEPVVEIGLETKRQPINELFGKVSEFRSNRKRDAELQSIPRYTISQDYATELPIDYGHLVGTGENRENSKEFTEMWDFLCSEQAKKFYYECRKRNIPIGLVSQVYTAYHKYPSFRWPMWVTYWIPVGAIILFLGLVIQHFAN